MSEDHKNRSRSIFNSVHTVNDIDIRGFGSVRRLLQKTKDKRDVKGFMGMSLFLVKERRESRR